MGLFSYEQRHFLCLNILFYICKSVRRHSLPTLGILLCGSFLYEHASIIWEEWKDLAGVPPERESRTSFRRDAEVHTHYHRNIFHCIVDYIRVPSLRIKAYPISTLPEHLHSTLHPISTLPEHLHSTFPSYAKIPENTLTEKKKFLFPL